MAKIGKFAQITAKVLQRIIWPTKIYGAENFEKFSGGIIISNHYASAADGSIIFNAFFKNYFNALVKEEAFKTKIGNWFLTGVGCIPVKRGEADIDAYKKVVTVLKKGENILIFPEGTRNKAGTDVMAPFKKGVSVFAMRTKVEILPTLYFRMHRPFRKNILVVGEPIDLLKEGFDRKQDAEATDFLYEKMQALRVKANEIAKERGLKQYPPRKVKAKK